MALATAAFRGGEQAALYFAAETGTYPHSADVLPTAPLSQTLAGYYHPADRNYNDNNRKKGGGGAFKPLYDQKGRREYDLRAAVMCGNGGTTLLASCIRTGTGYKGLPDLALYAGASNDFADGYIDILREVKCNSFDLIFAEDAEIMANAEFWGMALQSGTNVTPSVADLRTAGGECLHWYDLDNIDILGTNYRNIASRVAIQVRQNLKRIGQRPDSGDNDAISRCVYALRPGMQEVMLTLTLKDKVPAAWFNGGADATDVNDVVLTCGTATKNFSPTLTNCRFVSENRGGGDPAAELISTVQFVADDISFNTTVGP